MNNQYELERSLELYDDYDKEKYNKKTRHLRNMQTTRLSGMEE